MKGDVTMAEKQSREMVENHILGSTIDSQKERAKDVDSDRDESLEESDFKFGPVKAIIFLGFVCGFFADNLAVACISAVLTTVNNDLGPSTSYTWIASAVYTATSISSPFVGRLSDMFGRKYFLLLGNLLGALGCVVAATGTAISHLIIGSVFIGLGGSMNLLAWAAVGEIVPKKHRPLALGIYEIAITPSATFGVFIGQGLTQGTANSWRNIYWLCFAIHMLAVPIMMFLYHPVNQYIVEAGKTRLDQVKKLDFIGLTLFTIGLCLFLISLSFGGTQYPWASAGTLAPLLVGVLFLVFTGVYEFKSHNPYNIFPHSVMQELRGFTVVTGVAFLSGIVYYSSLILWPLQINTFYSTTIIGQGLYSMVWSAGAFIGAAIAGWLLQAVDRAKLVLTAFCALMTIASGTQAIANVNTQAASSVLVALTGLAVAGASVTINSIIQLTIPHQYVGVAVGLLTTFRYVGGSIGTTIYSTILSNYLQDHLGTNVGTALAAAGVPLADLPVVAGAIATGDTMNPALATVAPAALSAGVGALQMTYVRVFRLIYLISIAFGVLGTLCAVLTRNVGEFLTNKIDVQLDEGFHSGLHDVHKGGHIVDSRSD